ncbi:MAG: T9SS type A sorting domain-containing protein [Leadbetterella sp.]
MRYLSIFILLIPYLFVKAQVQITDFNNDVRSYIGGSFGNVLLVEGNLLYYSNQDGLPFVVDLRDPATHKQLFYNKQNIRFGQKVVYQNQNVFITKNDKNQFKLAKIEKDEIVFFEGLDSDILSTSGNYPSIKVFNDKLYIWTADIFLQTKLENNRVLLINKIEGNVISFSCDETYIYIQMYKPSKSNSSNELVVLDLNFVRKNNINEYVWLGDFAPLGERFTLIGSLYSEKIMYDKEEGKFIQIPMSNFTKGLIFEKQKELFSLEIDMSQYTRITQNIITPIAYKKIYPEMETIASFSCDYRFGVFTYLGSTGVPFPSLNSAFNMIKVKEKILFGAFDTEDGKIISTKIMSYDLEDFSKNIKVETTLAPPPSETIFKLTHGGSNIDLTGYFMSYTLNDKFFVLDSINNLKYKRISKGYRINSNYRNSDFVIIDSSGKESIINLLPYKNVIQSNLKVLISNDVLLINSEKPQPNNAILIQNQNKYEFQESFYQNKKIIFNDSLTLVYAIEYLGKVNLFVLDKKVNSFKKYYFEGRISQEAVYNDVKNKIYFEIVDYRSSQWHIIIVDLKTRQLIFNTLPKAQYKDLSILRVFENGKIVFANGDHTLNLKDIISCECNNYPQNIIQDKRYLFYFIFNNKSQSRDLIVHDKNSTKKVFLPKGLNYSLGYVKDDVFYTYNQDEKVKIDLNTLNIEIEEKLIDKDFRFYGYPPYSGILGYFEKNKLFIVYDGREIVIESPILNSSSINSLDNQVIIDGDETYLTLFNSIFHRKLFKRNNDNSLTELYDIKLVNYQLKFDDGIFKKSNDFLTFFSFKDKKEIVSDFIFNDVELESITNNLIRIKNKSYKIIGIFDLNAKKFRNFEEIKDFNILGISKEGILYDEYFQYSMKRLYYKSFESGDSQLLNDFIQPYFNYTYISQIDNNIYLKVTDRFNSLQVIKVSILGNNEDLVSNEVDFDPKLLYPNPFNNVVRTYSNKTDSLVIHNSKGILVKKTKILDNEVQTDDLKSGLYYFTLFYDNKKKVVRMLKE